MKPSLQQSDFAEAAQRLGCRVEAVMAVCTVEAPAGGFDSKGEPRILFEGHVFHRLTGGQFDSIAPAVSYPTWTRKHYATGNGDQRNVGEHARLQRAVGLSRSAALMSASWGRFQILGENYGVCGFDTLQSFINAMYESERQHLLAFVEYVRVFKLDKHLKSLDWAAFARRYNGPAYAQNSYDTKLAKAYESLT